MKLKAGVIGLGVGEQHIHGLRSADVEVVSLCDFAPEKQGMAAQKYPECKIFSDAGDVLSDPELDVVAIASYDHHHAAQILTAIENRKHVFAEKPMCLKESEATAIQHALKTSDGLRLSTNTILRQSPRFIDMKNRIESGEMGQVYNIEADYNYGRLHKITQGWRREIEDYSVMLGGGIHLIDLMLWMTGKRIVEVYAIGNKVCSDGAPFHTPDMVTAVLTFDDGMIGKISANFGCVMPHFHKMSIYGTEATFENDIPNGRLYKSREAGSLPKMLKTPYPGVNKGDLIPSFIDAIRGKGRAIVEEEDVFNALYACYAIDRSLQTQQPEKVKAA